ncbi:MULTISPECIES: hypothetical protein [Halorussus]|uniref:hypothetical protein n=1 Tax=Halorussus TaxID=1070314 RepID=UPI000E2165B6|nr:MULTISPECIES: hypothetical protein [Halorussus]NHN61597.1 hypothetical protein [Halorussus sp. JP-T4]
MSDHRVTVTGRTYRLLDYATKLAGLALVATGLEVGGATPAGLLLGVCGTVLGLTTVFIGKRQ